MLLLDGQSITNISFTNPQLAFMTCVCGLCTFFLVRLVHRFDKKLDSFQSIEHCRDLRHSGVACKKCDPAVEQMAEEVDAIRRVESDIHILSNTVYDLNQDVSSLLLALNKR